MPTKDPPNLMARPCQYQSATGKSGHDFIKSVTQSVNKQIVDFIWSQKNPKIKKTTMISEKRRGGGGGQGFQ